MKKYGISILSGVIGSALTMLAVLLFFPTGTKSFRIEHVTGIPSKSAVYTTDKSGNFIPLDFTEASKKVMKAVVNIKSTQIMNYTDNSQREMPGFNDDFYQFFFGPGERYGNPGEQVPPQARVGMGSGVIVNEEGYIVTNNHVIANASDIEVTLDDNRTYKASIVGADPATDLALIRIKESGLPALPLVNSDSVEVGEWVLAVGNPFELTSTVTAGIVSAKDRNINISREQNAIEAFIQTDAAINPGNSGGALVNLQGGLVGINTAIASPTGAYTGYGFAVSSNIVSKVVEDLITYGTVQRGYLGVLIRDVDGNFAKEKGLNLTEGAYIENVVEDGAAAKAGIKPGDVVISVEGTRVRQASELQEHVARHRPGDKIAVAVNRNGSVKEFAPVLQGSEGNTKVLTKERGELKSILGADFRAIDKDLARKLNIAGGVQVIRLLPGKLSGQTNMREGFIITKVNEKPVKTVDELTDMLQNKKGGVMLEGVYEGVEGVFYYAFGM